MDVLTIVKRSRFVFPLACVAAVAMMFISEGSYWRSVGSMDALGTMTTARTNIQLLQRSLVEAESGQRGYLLTGREEYLQPYREALAAIDDSFRALEAHYGDDAQPRDLLRQLHALTDTKLAELAVTMRLHVEGRTRASQELMLSDIGKEKMEAIRGAGSALLAHESRRVIASREDIYRTLLLSRIGVSTLSAISLLALFLYLRQSLALELQQREIKRVVQAERDRLEIEVASRTAELTELARHLQTAREDERSHLARDLHDELGALLTSAKLDAARIKSRLVKAPVLADEALARLAHLVETLNSGIALKRRIIEDLRPSALSSLGLVPTLEILAREYSESAGLPVHCQLTAVNLSASADLVVYRVVQEAFTNISKHAQASQLWLTLRPVKGPDGIEWVQATVRDDGVGFDSNLPTRAAHGLVGMRFRVEAEGGSFSVHSASGEGSLIEMRLPALTNQTKAMDLTVTSTATLTT